MLPLFHQIPSLETVVPVLDADAGFTTVPLEVVWARYIEPSSFVSLIPNPHLATYGPPDGAPAVNFFVVFR